MLDKVKNWIKAAGLTSLAYLGIFVAALIFGKTFFAGAALGIFVYVNFNVLKKIVQEDVVNKVLNK
jgi:hypothetical protein